MNNYDHLTPLNTRPVLVRWEDIVAADNWNEDDILQPIEVVTLGWLLEDSPTQMVIASTYNYKEEQWATLHALPKVMPTVEDIPAWEDTPPEEDSEWEDE